MSYEWALELGKRFPELFCINRHITTLWAERQAATGDLWYAHPAVGWAELVSLESGKKCPGSVREGKWHPITTTTRPASPMPCKFYVHDEATKPWLSPGPRPGIVLGDPYFQSEISRSLLTYDRVIWIRGVTRKDSRNTSPHAELPVRFRDRIGEYPVWCAWGVRATSGIDLLRQPNPPREQSLSDCRPVRDRDGKDLVARARELFAECIGVRDWSGAQNVPLPPKAPRRGELILLRLALTRVPCLVISPTQINARDKAVMLQCVTDDVNPDDPCWVKLPEAQYEGKPLHVGLHLVRGIEYAHLYIEPWGEPVRGTPAGRQTSEPDRQYYNAVDPKTFRHIHKQLRAFYA